MRGHPLLQMLLVGGLFVLAGFPVWKVTHPAAAAMPGVPGAAVDGAAAPAASPSPSQERVRKVGVVFSSAPADFRLSFLGKTVLEGHGPQTEFTADTGVDVPGDGADFALEVRWLGAEAGATPAAARHVAVRVVFHLDARDYERTVWSDGSVPTVEILTVPPA